MRMLRAACDSDATAPAKLAKAWCDTGLSDGTELGVDLERALAWCLPPVRPPALVAEGALSVTAAAELAARAILLDQERAPLPAAAPPPVRRKRRCIAARFLTGDAHLAALREAEEAAKQVAEALAAAKGAKKAGAAAEKARRAAEKLAAATLRRAAAEARRALKEAALVAARTIRAQKAAQKSALQAANAAAAPRKSPVSKP